MSEPFRLRWVPIAMLVLALLGFADAMYLTIEHFLGGTPLCTILKGCDIVTTSAYATIGPVPVALLGSLYYLIILFAVVGYLDTKRMEFLRVAAWLPLAGFVFTLYLFYLMAFVIGAWCIYCLGSSVTTVALAALGGWILARSPKKLIVI